MALTTYNRKRDFTKTAEPRGTRAKPHRELMFVVQKHDASRLHYDFRLELDGVLVSWAVPKGPSLNPADRRLAVHVEDHPVDYGTFEGTIPKGEYGGGTVLLWDRGVWSPLDPDPASALRKGKLSFVLHGERLQGEWTLARMHGPQRDGDENKNWLLIKKHDSHAKLRERPVTERFEQSVATARTMEQIAGKGSAAAGKADEPKVQTKLKRLSVSRKAPGRTTRQSPAARPAPAPSVPHGPADVRGAVKAAMPKRVMPELCTLAETVPSGPDWLHEIKFDGYRFLIRKSGSTVHLMTRSGKDWTAKFAPIAAAVMRLPVDSAILDGEATILNDAGRSSFQALQQAIKQHAFEKLAFFAFDLLYLDGYDLTGARLIDRKEQLRALLARSAEPMIRFSDHVVGHGETIQKQVCDLDLEGAISKRADSTYEQRRSPNWIKVKCGKRQEFVVVGYTPPQGSRQRFGSLLLAAHDDRDQLVYTGRVGTGFSAMTLRDLGKQLEHLRRTSMPLDALPPKEEVAGAKWVTPKLVAEVQFTEWTEDGRLRHPSFQGLREDKEASDVKIERPRVVSRIARATRSSRRGSPVPRLKAPPRRSAAPGSPVAGASVAGVPITNPGRLVYPDAELSKLDVARYYEMVAPLILPYLKNRPLSTVRCPQGRGKQCFFQKHIGEGFPASVHGIRITEKSGEAEYIAIDSVEGLVALVQFGVLEFHPWGARGEDVEHPDILTFDLDPGEDVGFGAVKEGAQAVRELLAGVNLESFVKTSGGKGLHVCVPLQPTADWDDAKAFTRAIALMLEQQFPAKYTANMSKAKRSGRIFVDYLRNGRGATSVAAYSTRARAGAPVSMPIRWQEVSGLKSAADYTVQQFLAGDYKRRADPWKDFFATRQRVPDDPARASADGESRGTKPSGRLAKGKAPVAKRKSRSR